MQITFTNRALISYLHLHCVVITGMLKCEHYSAARFFFQSEMKEANPTKVGKVSLLIRTVNRNSIFLSQGRSSFKSRKMVSL